ncbi:hypothetical protein L618_000100007160 [Rhodococcus rhodochrous J45]|uniref:Uncharacterized protein n=1 Tax=Rhodococcus rhodochrous J45 TaxID=935266 RepID=A0A562ET89_RHORH|nr:hypothetical protein L618_000100007160 [Rhodococcus rhodochrous J45]
MRVLCQPFQKREQSVRLRHELVGHDRHSILRIMSSPSFWCNRFGRMKIDYRVDRRSTADPEVPYPNSSNTFPGQEDVEYLLLEEDSTTYMAPYTALADVQGRLETDRDDQDCDQAHAGGAYRYEEGALTIVSVDRQQCFAEAAVPYECCRAAVGDKTEHCHDCGPHSGAVRENSKNHTVFGIVLNGDASRCTEVTKSCAPERGYGNHGHSK